MKPLAWGLLLAWVFGCGGSSPCPSATFPNTPLLSVASTTGALQLALRTSPQPPLRGCNTGQLTLTDSHGNAVAGLTITLVPWMPDMGHGASVQPSVVDEGAGNYLVNDLDLPMPGTWQLRTTFSGAVSDDATPSFQVP